MSKLLRTARRSVFGVAVLGTLGFGASTAFADVLRSPIFDSAEECRQYCDYLCKPNMSWDPGTGACRCW
jgi:hypothetical protein